MRLNLQSRLLIFLLFPVALINISTFLWGLVYSRETLIEQWIRAANVKLGYAADQIGRRLNEKLTIVKAIQQANSAPQGPIIKAFLVQLLLSTPEVRFVDIRRPSEASAEGSQQACRSPSDTGATRGHAGDLFPDDADRNRVSLLVDTGYHFFDIVSRYPETISGGCTELKVRIQFNSLIDEVRALPLWEGGKALLIDSDGLCLTATDPAWVGGRLSDFEHPLAKTILQEIRGRDSGVFFGEGRPPDLVMGFQRIASTGWYLVLYAEGCEICRPMIRFRWVFIAANVASLVFMVIFVWLVMQPIVQSIKGLSVCAEEVEHGNYSVKLVEDRVDEIGQLQRRFNKMVDGLKQRDIIQQMFGRYVGGAVAGELLKSAEGLDLGGQEKIVTILMADLRGFTLIAEKLQPRAVITLLNRYLARMIAIIEQHDGIIVDFFGDGILAFFDGTEDDVSRRATDAVLCAIQMQQGIRQVSQENLADGLPEIEMGIGIHTGQVIVGNVGSESRAKYGIVGSPVNLAQRLESIAAGGKIVVSAETYEKVSPTIKISGKSKVCFKGLNDAKDVFEVEYEDHTHRV